MQELQQRLERLMAFQLKDPSNNHLLLDIGLTHMQLRQFQQAISAFDQALALKTDAATFFHKATAHLALQEYALAITLLEQLLNQGIDNPGIRFNLGYAYLYNDNSTQAIEHLSQIPSESTDDIHDFSVIYARSLHIAGQLDLAALQLEQQLSKQPDNGRIKGMLALIEVDRENHQQAQRLAEEALQANPNDNDALVSLGSIATNEFDLQAAATYFDKALQNESNSGRAWLGKGLAAMSQTDLVTAEHSLSKAVEFMPTHLGAWNTLAWAQLATNKLDDAEKTIIKAQEIDRNFGDSYGTLAVIQWLQGHHEQALHNQKIGQKLDPQSFSCQYLDILRNEAAGKVLEARNSMINILNRPITPDNELTVTQGIQLIAKKQNTTPKED